jgi:Ca-activated chloride channel family protein
VTALYEIEPGVDLWSQVEPLRYQTTRPISPASRNVTELMHVKLRYKLPEARTSRWLDHVVRATETQPTDGSSDLRFAASVAAFGMVLRDSEYRGGATLEVAIALARGSIGEDVGGYRAEFLRMMETVQARSLLAAKER